MSLLWYFMAAVYRQRHNRVNLVFLPRHVGGVAVIKFLDPRGEVGTKLDSYDLSYDLLAAHNQGSTVGLLANGFPDSDNFLNALGAVLTERFPGLQVKFWNKGNASIAAPESMLDEIQSQCQVAIAAYGH
jgi:hypothetical protein